MESQAHHDHPQVEEAIGACFYPSGGSGGPILCEDTTRAECDDKEGSSWHRNVSCHIRGPFEEVLEKLKQCDELLDKLRRVFDSINKGTSEPLGVCTFSVGDTKIGLALTKAQCQAIPGASWQEVPAWKPKPHPCK
jgi:hypothetical protein